MIGVPANITVEEEITITVSGASRINQTITVTIDNGEGMHELVDIAIDEHGNGSSSWLVPEWEIANFNDGRCLQQTRFIA